MNLWTDYYVRQEQMTDRRQEAATYRMTRPAHSFTAVRTTIISQTMTLAGRRLMTRGHRLDAH